MDNDILHLSVIQDNPTVGDIDGNTAMVIDRLHETRDTAIDLLVFPECFITGYPLGDLVLRLDFLLQVKAGLEKIRAEVMQQAGAAVLIGAPTRGAALPHNAAFLLEPNGKVHIVCKRELPNHDVFDERRTFAMNETRPEPLAFRGFNLGIQICEDMWHGDVSRVLADELADFLIVLNGSPYQEGKQALRRRIARARIEDTGLPLIYANLVGGQDELVFDGGSFIMNPNRGHDGYTETAAFAPSVMDLILTRNEGGRTSIHLDSRFEIRHYPDNPLESDYNACVLALRDYVRKTGMPHVVVGVSGGLDSALVLTMAVDALGADHVIGVMMPSQFTGNESMSLAADLIRRLDVHCAILPINGMFDAVCDHTKDVLDDFGRRLGRNVSHGITRENYQARLRGLSLMGITNALGGIVLSTGNKSESSVGYATLYGDMSGGFNPLKSVYKSEAFMMAEWRNKQNCLIVSEKCVANPIPEGIIDRPPTAELSDGQTDEAALGDYELLDTVLKSLIEDRADVRAAARVLESRYEADDIRKLTGMDDAGSYAEKIARLVRNAQYKRDQSCPGVKLNLTDFGLGWRYPIAGNYEL